MGIHIHQEIKIGGQWEHYRETRFLRNYETFSKMVAIAAPRGLPADASKVTKFSANRGDNGFLYSWLGAEEILELESWIDSQLVRKEWCLETDGWGYLFGGRWGEFAKYPEDRPKGLEDIRFVFWFDN